MNFKKTLLAAAIFGISANASATIVSTSSLQDGLNALTDGGNFYDVNTAQYNPDEVWTTTATGSSVNHLIFEFASYEAGTKFGIYDISDETNTLELFNGLTCGTTDASCSGVSTFADRTTLDQSGTYFENSKTGANATFGSSSFGYYLDSTAGDLDPSTVDNGGLFYSQASLNTDVANNAHGNTTDHMIAFRGDDALGLAIDGGTSYKTFSSGEYILAWEDLNFPGSDYDYSDFVVMVESVETVPEPASIALLGLGLAGLGFARRNNKA